VSSHLITQGQQRYQDIVVLSRDGIKSIHSPSNLLHTPISTLSSVLKHSVLYRVVKIMLLLFDRKEIRLVFENDSSIRKPSCRLTTMPHHYCREELRKPVS